MKKMLFSTVLAFAVAGCQFFENKTTEAPAKKVENNAVKPAQKAPAKRAARRKAVKLTPAQELKEATTPVQARRHAKRHAIKKAYAAANKDKIKIVMLGDSITHQWEYPSAKKAAQKYLAPYGVLNLGCGSDCTQHTIWIAEKSGILDLVEPKLVTLMIGTNNRYNPDATAAGIKRILDGVRKRYPQAKILLYAIFPRGNKPGNRLRVTNDKINARIVKFCDGKNIIWVDIRKDFLSKDGILDKRIMPDYLHPRNVEGYTIWGKSLQPYFEKYGK